MTANKTEQIEAFATKIFELKKEFSSMILNMMSEGALSDMDINIAGEVDNGFWTMTSLLMELKAEKN